MAAEEIAVVKEELAQKQQALEALQRNFDDFQESSRELEEELEAELGRVRSLYSLQNSNSRAAADVFFVCLNRTVACCTVSIRTRLVLRSSSNTSSREKNA